MFTTEIDFDEIKITVLDDRGFYEDVDVFLYDDVSIIRQWDELSGQYKFITMTPDMFDSITKALDMPEGSYRLNRGTS